MLQVDTNQTLGICIYSPSYLPTVGGLERMGEMLATRFAEFGHRVTVVTSTPDDGSQLVPTSYRIARSRRFSEQLRAMRDADVVLFMNLSLVGLVPALALNKPVVVSNHGCYEGVGLRGVAMEFLKRRLLRFFAGISCSAYVAGRVPGRSLVVANAVDDLFLVPRQSAPRDRDFVFCGRLVKEKGCDVLLRAFARTTRAVPDVTLTIAGSGPELEALQMLAADNGVAASVEFAGRLGGLALVRTLDRHHCMVVPSLWEEPFGIVALEGIACCETVIATRRGGLPEAVGPCGTIVEADEESLATAMLECARARRDRRATPGRPSDEVRARHLAAHCQDAVARAYVGVLEAAAR